MTTVRKLRYAAVLVTVLVCGCARSPEARRDAYLAKGKKFLEAKDYSRAAVEFKNAIQATPKDAEPYYQLSLAVIASSDFRTAVISLRKALDLNPNHTGARLKISQIMASASEDSWVKEAENRLNELIKTAPITPEMLNTLAVTELKLGKTEDAIQTLEKALNAAPQQLSSSIMLARAKLMQKDVAGAEAVLIKACDTAPNSAEPRLMLGEFYASQNKLREAEAEFQRAIKIEPNSGRVLSNLARLQNSLGRKQEAEQSFKRMSSLSDKSYKSMYALFLFGEGRHDEAIREFEKLVSEDPQDRLARTQLVAAYLATNRSGEATKILEQALKANGNDLDALLQRAEMYRSAGKYAEAEADLNQVLRLKPDSGEVHYVMAKLHQARGNVLSYREQLAKALQLNPYLLSVRLELVQQLLSIKESRAASDVLNATPDSQKNSTAVRAQRNWVLWTSGDMVEMRKGIDLGLSRERSMELLIQDGLWKLRAGNPAGARASLEEALKIDSSEVRALSALSMTYVAQKQNALALQKVKEYASSQPKSAPVQEFLGKVLMSSGDRAQARAAFEASKMADARFVSAEISLIQIDLLDGKLDDAHRRLQGVLSANGGDLRARLWMGNLEAMKGNHKAALEQFRQVVAADPSNAQGLNNLAYMLAEFSNQPAEALKYAQKAKELAPDSPEYSNTLGWIFYRQGLYPLAVKELERAAANSQANPVWKYHLAMAYAKAGDTKRGRATLQAALERDPNLPEAKLAQEMLGVTK